MQVKSFSLLLIFLLIFNKGDAQKEIVRQNLWWMRYYNQTTLKNTKLVFHYEIEGRRFLETKERHHFITHARLHYKVNSQFNVGGGVTYSRQSSQFPIREDNLVVPEIRFVQEANYNIPINKRIALQQRFRIDERFIRINNGSELLDGYYFNFRFRFRFQGNFRLNSDENKKPTILKISDEVMFNAGSKITYNIFDQNRLYFGLEQQFSKSIAGEVGYLHWFQQTAAGNIFFQRNIVRFTLFHNIFLY